MPNISDSYLDRRLTNVARLDFSNKGFIHDMLFPNIGNLKEKTGKIARMGNEHMRYFGTTKRASYDESAHRVDFKYQDDDSYKIESHDVEVFLPSDFITQAQKPFDARNDARMFLEGLRNVAMEKPIADLLGSTTTLTNYTTPTAKWDDGGTASDPFGDMETARKGVEDKTGNTPNRAIIQSDVLSALKTHPDFLGKLQGFNRPSVLTADNVLMLIKDFLGLDELPMVARAQYISTAPGQTETKAKIWGEDMILYYVPPTPTLWTPSLGYRLTRPAMLNGMKLAGAGANKAVYVRPHPTNPRLGEIIEMAWEYQDLILDVNNAYLLNSVLT